MCLIRKFDITIYWIRSLPCNLPYFSYDWRRSIHALTFLTQVPMHRPNRVQTTLIRRSRLRSGRGSLMRAGQSGPRRVKGQCRMSTDVNCPHEHLLPYGNMTEESSLYFLVFQNGLGPSLFKEALGPSTRSGIQTRLFLAWVIKKYV